GSFAARVSVATWAMAGESTCRRIQSFASVLSNRGRCGSPLPLTHSDQRVRNRLKVLGALAQSRLHESNEEGFDEFGRIILERGHPCGLPVDRCKKRRR